MTDMDMDIGLRDTGPSWVASQRLWGARRPGNQRTAPGAGGPRGPRGRRPPGAGAGPPASPWAPPPVRPGGSARLLRSAAGQAGPVALRAAAAWGARVGSASPTHSTRQAAASGQSRPGPRGPPEGRGRRDLGRCAGVLGRAQPEGTECDDKVTGLRGRAEEKSHSDRSLWDQQPDGVSVEGTRAEKSRSDRTVWQTRWGGVSACGVWIWLARWLGLRWGDSGWEVTFWQGCVTDSLTLSRLEGIRAGKPHSDRTESDQVTESWLKGPRLRRRQTLDRTECDRQGDRVWVWGDRAGWGEVTQEKSERVIAGRGRGLRDRVRGLGWGPVTLLESRVWLTGWLSSWGAPARCGGPQCFPERVRRQACVWARNRVAPVPDPDRKARSPELPRWGPHCADPGDRFREGLASSHRSPWGSRGRRVGRRMRPWSRRRFGPRPPARGSPGVRKAGSLSPRPRPASAPLQSKQGASTGPGSRE
jgi:hypothetical protein